jgi:PHD/YefM family antitoxin component YafN of YafNO toxin-antitoxin module
MQTVTATEFARNFRQMLDQVEHRGEVIAIVRNQRAVATVIPGVAHMTAMEAFGDLYGTLDNEAAATWLEDARRVDEALDGYIDGTPKDPWA